MNKLAALEEVKGVASGRVYASKYAELELVDEHDGHLMLYQNKITGEKFFCHKEKTGYVSENLLAEESVAVKKQNESKLKKGDANTNQLNLFV